MSATIVTRCDCRRFNVPDRDRCKCGEAIKSRKLKLYYIDFQGEDSPKPGKRVWVRVGWSTNKVAALAKREQLLTEITTGRYVHDNQSRKLTLGQLRDWYLARAETKLLESYDIAKIHMRNIVEGMGANKLVSSLEISDAREYREHRLKLPRAPSTINKELGQLVAALNAATQGKLNGKPMLSRNPIAGMKKLREDNARDFPISVEQVDVLIDACRVAYAPGDDWLAIAVEIGFFSLMREGEICGLTPDRVFMNEGVLKLRAVDTKARTPRIVTMHPRVVRALKRTQVNWLKHGHVLCRADGVKVTTKMIQVGLRRVVERLGLVHPDYGRFHFHDLRHSGKEFYEALGSAERAVMSLGGWKTDAQARRYGSKNPVKLQQGMVWDAPKPRPRSKGRK